MFHRLMPPVRAVRTALVLAAVALTGCAAAEGVVAPDALDAPAAQPHTLTASPALLAAMGDAELRLLPTVDPALQPALGGALAELHAALDAGEVARTRRALAAMRSLVADAPTSETADATLASEDGAADLAAIAMLVAAAEHELTPPAAAAAPVE